VEGLNATFEAGYTAISSSNFNGTLQLSFTASANPVSISG